MKRIYSQKMTNQGPSKKIQPLGATAFNLEWVQGNSLLEISQKFTGANTYDLKILRVPGTRGNRSNQAPANVLSFKLIDRSIYRRDQNSTYDCNYMK